MVETIKKIVLFRSPTEGDEDEDPYEQVLSSAGCCVWSIPALAYEFIHLEELTMAVTNVDEYSGIIFTSRRAVEAVQNVLPKIKQRLQVKAKWKEQPAFAVGRTTSKLAADLGFSVTGEESGNSKSLSSFILERMERDAKPLLYPCGNLKRDTLPNVMYDNGQKLKEIVVYKTSQNSDLEELISQHLRKQGQPSCLVYFSPSGVRFTWDILQKYGVPIQEIQVVAIGPSTEEELKKYKISVYGTALKPTPESLYQVIFNTNAESSEAGVQGNRAVAS